MYQLTNQSDQSCEATFLKDDRVLKSMIKTGSLFHMLMTLSVKNNNLILQEL